jgi:hypothetical protein
VIVISTNPTLPNIKKRKQGITSLQRIQELEKFSGTSYVHIILTGDGMVYNYDSYENIFRLRMTPGTVSIESFGIRQLEDSGFIVSKIFKKKVIKNVALPDRLLHHELIYPLSEKTQITRKEAEKKKLTPTKKVTRESLEKFLLTKGFELDRWNYLKKRVGGTLYRWKLTARVARKERQVKGETSRENRWVKVVSAYYGNIQFTDDKIKILKAN